MPNHVHLIAAAGGRLHEVMRNFKRFTSLQIHERLKADGRKGVIQRPEHRRFSSAAAYAGEGTSCIEVDLPEW